MLDSVVKEVCSIVRSRRDTSIRVVEEAIRSVAPLLGPTEKDVLIRRVEAELHGFGALQEFLDDPQVREVMVNHATELWVDKNTGPEFVGTIDPEKVDAFLERVLTPLVRRLDLVNPVVDARLADGSRLCAVIPPVAARGTCLAVRKFAITPIPLGAFLDRSGVQLLQEIVHRRCNVLVSGPTSSGKTTLLNAITELVPDGERIVTIEDTSELQPRTSHVVGLESRPGNNEGLTEITASHLLRAALRLRPDRLVIGEIRGDEAVELVQAMNTGHDGTLATCHANSAEDALRRIEGLIMRATNWSAEVVREHIRNSIDVVIHVARSVTGVRAVAHIAEVDREARGSLRTRMIWCDSQQLVPLRNWR